MAFFTQSVGRRNAAVVENDLGGIATVLTKLVFEPCHAIARGVGGHQECADAPLARSLVGDGHDDGHIAVLAAGDELLDAVDDVAIGITHRCRLEAVGL